MEEEERSEEPLVKVTNKKEKEVWRRKRNDRHKNVPPPRKLSFFGDIHWIRHEIKGHKMSLLATGIEFLVPASLALARPDLLRPNRIK